VTRRPKLSTRLDANEFLEYYWLKNELLVFCREQKLPVGGNKQEITRRIATWLDTRQPPRAEKRSTRPASTFDWQSEHLTKKTKITDSYKNTQNVRRFFKLEIGNEFSFNVTFMSWINSNSGKTLGDAIVQWEKIKQERAAPGFKPKIAPQFEYNTYVQAFMQDNPNRSRADATSCWKKKKGLRGHNRYEKHDLEFL